MRNIILLIIIILFTSCNSKLRNTEEELETQKKIILELKNNYRTEKQKNDSITKANQRVYDSLKLIEKKLIIKIDSILRLQQKPITSSTITIDSIHYTDIISDKYWKRGVYYKSNNEGDRFYNVKVSTINNQLRFFFLGVNKKQKDKEPIVNIYELDEFKEIYLIDSFKVSYNANYLGGCEHLHLDDALLKQLDNLIIKEDTLYYYKTIEGDRNYYSYKIGSKGKSKRIKTKIKSNRIFCSDYPIRGFINPLKTIIASTANYSMSFNYLVSENVDIKNLDKLPKVDFEFDSLFKTEEGILIEPNTNKGIFIGGIDWHKTKNILYFDNSGFDFRCIWELDLDNKKILKIVPEHEAIHPFFINERYIAYVENNKIMICESPN